MRYPYFHFFGKYFALSNTFRAESVKKNTLYVNDDDGDDYDGWRFNLNFADFNISRL